MTRGGAGVIVVREHIAPESSQHVEPSQMSQHSHNRTRTVSTQVQVPAFPREAAVTTYWPPSPLQERLSPASEVAVLAPSRPRSAKFAYTTTGEECLSYRIDSDDTAVSDARHLVTAWLEARS